MPNNLIFIFLVVIILLFYFLFKKKRKRTTDEQATNEASFKMQTGITLTTSSISDLKTGIKYTMGDIVDFHESIDAEKRTDENIPSEHELEFLKKHIMVEKEVQREIDADDLDEFIEKMTHRSKNRKKKKEENNRDSNVGMDQELIAQFQAYTKQIEEELAELKLDWENPA